MRSPFPGMDPYLEAPEIWPDFHDRLAHAISRRLNELLPRPYYTRLELRSEVGIVEDDGPSVTRRIVPDVTIVRGRETGGTAVADQPVAAAPGWVEIKTFFEYVRHPLVEIRDPTRGHELITLIEIASPSNKAAGPDRKSYLRKQREILDSEASLIELDLLRAGERLFAFLERNHRLAEQIEESAPGAQYFFSISRAWERGPNGASLLRGIRLDETLPALYVPLRQGQTETVLEMQAVFAEAYSSGAYRRGAVDYSQPPNPPLPPEWDAWRIERLAADANLPR